MTKAMMHEAKEFHRKRIYRCGLCGCLLRSDDTPEGWEKIAIMHRGVSDLCPECADKFDRLWADKEDDEDDGI